MKIKKRVIFSRHGLRYPLFYRDILLKEFKKDVIKWDFSDEDMGILTKKGEVIEYRFGQELKDMLNIKEDTSIHITSNSTKRTYLTAKLLSTAMFPYRNIEPEYLYKDFSKLESKYNIVFFDENILNHDIPKEIDKKLFPIYTKIEELLELKKGTITNNPTYIFIDDNGYTQVRGALRIATDLSDLCVLKYYEGFDYEDIFKSDNFIEDLRYILDAKDQFLDMIFADKAYIEASQDHAFNIFKKEILNDKELSIVVGHDSNISTILSTLNIEYSRNEYTLEKYPIGSKLILEIFEDNTYKLYYSYFSYEDIRNTGFGKPIMELLKTGYINEIMEK